jgi:hypothetical protein
LLAHGRWFSPASSTTKTGRHDIAEILLKVALKHQKSKSNHDSEVETTDMYWSEYTTFSGNFVTLLQRFQVILFSFINLYTHKGNG